MKSNQQVEGYPEYKQIRRITYNDEEGIELKAELPEDFSGRQEDAMRWILCMKAYFIINRDIVLTMKKHKLLGTQQRYNYTPNLQAQQTGDTHIETDVLPKSNTVTIEEVPSSFSPFSLVDYTLLSHFSFNDFITVAFPDLAGDLDTLI